jgi:hypothetical protein
MQTTVDMRLRLLLLLVAYGGAAASLVPKHVVINRLAEDAVVASTKLHVSWTLECQLEAPRCRGLQQEALQITVQHVESGAVVHTDTGEQQDQATPAASVKLSADALRSGKSPPSLLTRP